MRRIATRLLGLLALIFCTASVRANPVLIDISCQIVRLDEINMAGFFSVGAYISLKWSTPQLPPAAAVDCSAANFDPAARITYELRTLQRTEPRCRVSSEREFFYDFYVSTVVKETFRLEQFPIDKHSLNFGIELAHDVGVAELRTAIYNVEPTAMAVLEWEIQNQYARAVEVSYEAWSNSRSRAFFSVDITRTVDLFLTQVAVPSVVLTIIPWCGFYLGYEQVMPRVTLCIISLLTLLTLRSSVTSHLPRTSSSTWVDTGFILSFSIVSITFVWGLSVINLSSHGQKRKAKLVNDVGKLVMPLLSGMFAAMMLGLLIDVLMIIPVTVITLTALGIMHHKKIRRACCGYDDPIDLKGVEMGAGLGSKPITTPPKTTDSPGSESYSDSEAGYRSRRHHRHHHRRHGRRRRDDEYSIDIVPYPNAKSPGEALDIIRNNPMPPALGQSSVARM